MYVCQPLLTCNVFQAASLEARATEMEASVQFFGEVRDPY
jgi:hypothetical protein